MNFQYTNDMTKYKHEYGMQNYSHPYFTTCMETKSQAQQKYIMRLPLFPEIKMHFLHKKINGPTQLCNS